MRNKLLVRLCLNLMAIFMICSCRTDQFSEHETYSDSPTFHLTTKRISLDASKHKTKILPELEKAKAGIRAFSKVNVNGKIINYGNGVSIDTDDVIYIENGPNYHTYTFHIKRDDAPEDAPLENLLLSPLPDGSYRELLITYTLTSTEKERLKAGLMVDTKGKTQVTELVNGTFNGSGQLARLVCSTKTESYWAPCSGTQQHNGSNYESCPIYNGLEQGTPPILYTIVTTTCLEQNDDIITPIDPGTGGGGGGGSTGGGENPHDPPCDTSIIPSNPESGFTDENGCPIGLPSLPNLPPKNDLCEQIKLQRADIEFKNKITDLEGKTNLKKETGYIQKWSGDYIYKDNAGATNNANTLSLPSVVTNTYIKGFIHTHVNNYKFLDAQGYETDMNGIKMFSPADIAYFMDLVKNAQTTGQPLNNVYGVMVSSLGNYQIRFTGNQYQIKTFTDAQTETYKDLFVDFMKYRNENVKAREFGFLKFIDEKMNLKGISLYRTNTNGTTTEIKLNATKTDTDEINCPN